MNILVCVFTIQRAKGSSNLSRLGSHPAPGKAWWSVRIWRGVEVLSFLYPALLLPSWFCLSLRSLLLKILFPFFWTFGVSETASCVATNSSSTHSFRNLLSFLFRIPSVSTRTTRTLPSPSQPTFCRHVLSTPTRSNGSCL